jgi:hypothetical protein
MVRLKQSSSVLKDEKLKALWEAHEKVRIQWRFRCLEEVVLQFGRAYHPAPSPFPPAPTACFQKAYRAAARQGSRWIYVEGYAISGTIGGGLHHAWLTRADTPDVAYDVAWLDTERAHYLGIPFQIEYVRQVHLASKRHRYPGGPRYGVLEAWWLDLPLVTGKTPIEDVMWKPKAAE